MEELVKDILFLQEKIELVDQHNQFSINLMVALITLAIAIAGIALYRLAKNWVDECVKKELKITFQEIEELKKTNNELRLNIDNIINQNNNLIRSNGGDGWGYIHLGDGTHICYLKAKAKIDGSCIRQYMFPIAFDSDERVVPTVSILKSNKVVASIESVTAGGISIEFNSCNKAIGEEFEVSIIAIGRFANKIK